MDEQDNLPEDWEPYAVQPSVGGLFWVGVLSLLLIVGALVYSRVGDYEVVRKSVCVVSEGRNQKGETHTYRVCEVDPR